MNGHVPTYLTAGRTGGAGSSGVCKKAPETWEIEEDQKQDEFHLETRVSTSVSILDFVAFDLDFSNIMYLI